MPKRNSRRQSRAQKRQKSHRRSLKGGRKEEEPKNEEEPKKEEEPKSMLSGLFGSAEEKPEEPAPEEPAPAEEPGLLSGIMGKKEEEPVVPVAKKSKRHGKYYTNKQINAVCAKKAKARRSHKMIKRGRRQFNNFEQPRNAYLFEPKM